MPKRDIIIAAAGFEYYTTMIPVVTYGADQSYLSLFSVTGTLLGQVGFGTFVTFSYTFQRYKNTLYAINNSSEIYRFNLLTFTRLSALTIPSGTNNFAQWVRVSDSQLLMVDTVNSKYSFLNMATGTFSTTSGYTAATAPSGYTGGQGAVSFYDRSVGALSNFKNRVYWSCGAAAGSPYTGEIRTATFSGTTLSASSVVVPSTSNYSRMWGSTGNSTTGVVTIFDFGLYKALGDSASATSWLPSSGSFYSQFSGNYTPLCLSSNLYLYGMPSTSAISVFNFGASSGTQSPTSLITGLPTNAPVFMYQITSTGNVAVVTFGSAASMTIRIFNGASLLNTYSYTFNSAISNSISSSAYSNSNSELAVYNS